MSLLLMRDLEWLAFFLILNILPFVLLAATRRRRSADLEPEHEP